MTSDDARALADGDTAEKAPFDTSVAHQARMYDYVLGPARLVSGRRAGLICRGRQCGRHWAWCR